MVTTAGLPRRSLWSRPSASTADGEGGRHVAEADGPVEINHGSKFLATAFRGSPGEWIFPAAARVSQGTIGANRTNEGQP